jgi:hypothetical protein
MILEVLADPRQVGDDLDPDLAKMIGGSDAREHEQLR